MRSLAAGVITIEMAIKKAFDPWPQIDFLMIFVKIGFFIIFLCWGAPGTRQEAPGTPGIDSTSTEKNLIFLMFFNFSLFFHLFSLSLHNPSFGTITGSWDPSRIVDLGWDFILMYLLSLLVH